MTGQQRYENAISVLKTMLQKGIISAAEFTKAEKFLAKKNCIKKGSLFRQNHLIISEVYGIYMHTEKTEDKNGNSKKD